MRLREAGARRRLAGKAAGLAVLLFLTLPAYAQEQDAYVPPDELKKLSVEELMDLSVTSVSRRPERLSETASAIQVITGDAIRRSGATNLAEALRLAPNLQVAQLNSYGWIIGTRGFNALFANKLLVMIDGRVVYTPLFAGVSWDVQNVLLEDIDRIEVVSGPGGTLWGANAVNGVINIITRSAEDTRGIYASVAAGSFLEDWGAVRIGGRIGRDLSVRVYAQHFDRDNTVLPDGVDDDDAWRLTQSGVRMDWRPSDADVVTLQGDLYVGKQHTLPGASAMNGQNAMATWTRTFSIDSDLTLQLYVDHTWRRDVPSTFTDELTTYDLDFQHRFPLGGRHGIVWGAGARLMDSDLTNATDFVGFVPAGRRMKLFSGFVQDEIALVRDRLRLVVGTKLEHNDFSGFEVQPSTRLAWTPDARHTLWGAVSRAVRSPSRIDVDYHLPVTPLPPDQPSVAGGPNFDSEKVVAYELGYRVQPGARLSLSLAAFYNRYDDLYSVEPLPGTQTYQVQNGSEGRTLGAEAIGTYEPAGWWRLRGGYTFVHKDLGSKPGHSFDTSLLGNDPQHQFLLRSMIDLPAGLQFDLQGRYVDKRPAPHVPRYVTVDARLAWMFRDWEVSVVGQNLWEEQHVEYGSQLPRSIYARLTWRP